MILYVKTLLWAGDVHSRHQGAFKALYQLSHLHAAISIIMPQSAKDHPGFHPVLSDTFLHCLIYDLYHLTRGQPLIKVKVGSKSEFGINYIILFQLIKKVIHDHSNILRRLHEMKASVCFFYVLLQAGTLCRDPEFFLIVIQSSPRLQLL